MEGVNLGTAFAALVKRIEVLEAREREAAERLAVLEAEAKQGRRWWRTK